MNKLLALIAATCLAVPVTVEAGGCVQSHGLQPVGFRHNVQRVVKQQAVNYGFNNFAHNNGYQAAFVAVEQPYYLDLVASAKRQELQAAKFETAVEAQVATVLDTRLSQLTLEIQKLRKGDTGHTTPEPAPGTPPLPPAPGGNPLDATGGRDDVTKQLTEFLRVKCAECHTGSTAQGSFVLFGDDDAPQLSAGKLIRSDLMLYSNRMPPVTKLTDDEYQSFRGAYQTWEREIRDAAIKVDQ